MSSKKIPLHIVDDHNDILNFILRAIGSKKLNFSNNLLIHFDSHPDLLLDTSLKSSDIYDKEALLDKVSIETWILPLAYPEHFTTVVWVKPSWCNQIDEGTYKFYIGENREHELKVTAPLLYFVSALNYAPLEDLLNPKEIILHVMSIGKSYENVVVCKSKLLALVNSHDSNYILDIDLDYFSTLNPFIDMYKKAEMYEKLKLIYKFENSELENNSAKDAQKKRKIQIDKLENIFLSLGTFESQEEFRNIDDLCNTINDPSILNVLKLLINDLHKYYGEKVEWEMIHSAGTTIDDPLRVLPHHPSTDDEILRSIDIFEEMVKDLAPPKMISVARSSSDDYCPLDKVDFIQERVCDVLNKYFDFNITH